MKLGAKLIATAATAALAFAPVAAQASVRASSSPVTVSANVAPVAGESEFGGGEEFPLEILLLLLAIIAAIIAAAAGGGRSRG